MPITVVLLFIGSKCSRPVKSSEQLGCLLMSKSIRSLDEVIWILKKETRIAARATCVRDISTAQQALRTVVVLGLHACRLLHHVLRAGVDV